MSDSMAAKKNAGVAPMRGPPILETQGLGADLVLSAAVKSGSRHVIQTDGVQPEAELKFANLVEQFGDSFFSSPAEFILPHGNTHVRISARAMEAKQKALEPFQTFINTFKAARVVNTQISLVADEMFTNASKNSGVFYKRETVGPARLIRDGQVELQLRSDGHRILLVCIDSFGALNTKLFLETVLGCYEQGISQSIRSGTGGAGIGGFLMFDSCCSLYLGVRPNDKTVVACAFPVVKKSKQLEGITKNIHIVGQF